MMGDVITAVFKDRFRGGLAIDTKVEAPKFEVGPKQSYYDVTIPFHVHYRTLENDPYSQ